ncbi:MAG: hypothetical protein Q9164_007769, partial [Protoblastenia rupestris]
MDKLGGGLVNCFDAVDGVYKSLETVYLREEEDERKRQQARFQETVMCSRSGKPVMHAEGRVGLSLQYWMDQRHLLEDQDTGDAMEVDGAAKPEPSDEDSSTWSAIIECETCPADIYTPVRVSEKWVQESEETTAVQDEDPMQVANINVHWLEPPANIKGPNSEIASDKTLPDVRFVARLEPPIIVPLQLALHMQESLGSPISQETIMPTTYESLIFADADAGNSAQPSTPRTQKKMLSVYNTATDTSKPHQHKYTLYTPLQDFARSLTNLPFRHPMQIVNILPTLRQWALIGSLLRRSFVSTPSDTFDQAPTATNGITTANSHPENDAPPPPTTTPPFQTLGEELAAFLSSPILPTDSSFSNSNGSADAVRNIDISFTAAPIPQFQIQFPNPRFTGKVATIQFSCGLNGVIENVDVDDGGPPPPAANGGGGGEEVM